MAQDAFYSCTHMATVGVKGLNLSVKERTLFVDIDIVVFCSNILCLLALLRIHAAILVSFRSKRELVEWIYHLLRVLVNANV